MNNPGLKIKLLLLLLLAAPLRAAEPVHLLPKIETALKEVRGPMAYVAGKLGRLDYTVKDGRADPATVGAVQRFFKPLEARGMEAFPEILQVHSAKARQKADREIEGYARSVEHDKPRGEHIAGAGDVLLDDRLLLPPGYEEALVDLVNDRADKVSAFEKNRLTAIKELYAIAGQLDAPQARPRDPASLTEQDCWTMRNAARDVARFVLSDGMSAAADNYDLQGGVEDLQNLVDEVFLSDEGVNPALHEQLYSRASFVVQSYIDTVSGDEGLPPEYKSDLLERARLFQKLLDRYR